MARRRRRKSGGMGNGPAAPGAAQQYGAWPNAGFDAAAGMGGGAAAGMGPGYGQGNGGYGPAYGQSPYGPPPYGAPGPGMDGGLLQGMAAFFPSRGTEQFVLGMMIGAAAAWVLTDEELRGKLVKAGMKLYAGVAGGFEEMKEQMADIRAEVDAERHTQT